MINCILNDKIEMWEERYEQGRQCVLQVPLLITHILLFI